jgi:hypothetical protein
MSRERLWPLASYMATIIGILELGMDGKIRTAIHASKNGLRLSIGGTTVARGRDGYELQRNFDQARIDAKKRAST